MGTNENTKDGLVGETDKGWKISKKVFFDWYLYSFEKSIEL